MISLAVTKAVSVFFCGMAFSRARRFPPPPRHGGPGPASYKLESQPLRWRRSPEWLIGRPKESRLREKPVPTKPQANGLNPTLLTSHARQAPKLLGTGNFCEVWLVDGNAHKTSKSGDRNEVLAEERILKKLGEHPNVVNLIRLHGDQHPVNGTITLSLVLQHLPGGTWQARAPQEARQATGAMKDVLQGLQHVHRFKIVHCDLKPENVLFDSKNRAVIADFGTAVDLTAESWAHTARRGDVRYASPEFLAGRVFDTSTDIYSAGKSLCDVLQPPKDAPLLDALFGIPSFSDEMSTLPPVLARYVAGLVNREPWHRPTAEAAAEQLQSLALQLGSC